MFVLALVFAAMYTMTNAFQPFLQDIGYQVGVFSIILPAMFILQGIGGLVAEKTYGRLGENVFFWIVLVLFGTSIALLGLVPVKPILISLFAYQFLLGVIGPINSVYANRHIASHERATVISVQSMISTIAASLPLFLFGFLSDKFGLSNLLIVFGAFLLVSGVSLMINKSKNQGV